MKLITLATAAFSAVAIAAVPLSAASGSTALRHDYTVTFDAEMTVAAMNDALPSDAHIQQMIRIFTSDSGVLYVGHVVNDPSDSSLASYEQSVDTTLQDLAGDSTDTRLSAQLAGATSELAARGTLISKIVVEADESDEGQLSTMGDVVRHEAPTEEPQTVRQEACGVIFGPSYISVASNISVSGQRYGKQNMKWDSTHMASLKCRKDSPARGYDLTYEPDFITNNYDGKRYFSDTYKAWSSNFPNAYLDTKIDDGPNEKVFTVGTHSANDLVTNTLYNTYFRVLNGNWSSDTGKIQGQWGRHVPWYEWSTYTVFSQATERIMDAWVVPLPGTRTITNR